MQAVCGRIPIIPRLNGVTLHSLNPSRNFGVQFTDREIVRPMILTLALIIAMLPTYNSKFISSPCPLFLSLNTLHFNHLT